MSGFDSHVNIENADAVKVSGFDNAVTKPDAAMAS
jgi:hypothetical protein